MGITVECKNINTNPKDRAELIKGGGKNQVPCLRIENNQETQWLYESNNIINYLKQYD